MILGQAMESSAGDPTNAGNIRSEFFYDPFMAGDKAEHANIFYKIMKGITHREIKEVSGEEYNAYLREAEEFVNKMQDFIEK